MRAECYGKLFLKDFNKNYIERWIVIKRLSIKVNEIT